MIILSVESVSILYSVILFCDAYNLLLSILGSDVSIFCIPHSCDDANNPCFSGDAFVWSFSLYGTSLYSCILYEGSILLSFSLFCFPKEIGYYIFNLIIWLF
jgi:hypothetical protein